MVNEVRNGMSAALLPPVWRKSSYSGAVGNCVEVAVLAEDRVAVRNSRNASGPALVCTFGDLQALVAHVKK